MAGAKSAFFNPLIVNPGSYDVYVAWGPANNRRYPITHRVCHTAGISEYLIGQSTTADEWISLGRHVFAAGTSGYAEVCNANIDESGSMYAAAVKFVPVAVVSVADWEIY
ncbi:MAG: hypothetical protein WCK47_11775 [bacterium]|nr:hypothetical protein [Candidatus Sumerlaeota bacterium]